MARNYMHCKNPGITGPMTEHKIPLAVFNWRHRYGTFKDRKNKSKLGLYPRNFNSEFWQGTKFEPDARAKDVDASDFKPILQSPRPELKDGGIQEIVRMAAGTDSDETGTAGTDEQIKKDPRGGKRKGAGRGKKGRGKRTKKKAW